MARKQIDIMARIRAAYDKSGLSLDEFGQRMGYEKEIARKAAWQFLNKTADPRLSTIEKCSAALGIRLADLFADASRR